MIFVYSLLKKCRLFGNFSLDKTRQKEKRERYRRSPILFHFRKQSIRLFYDVQRGVRACHFFKILLCRDSVILCQIDFGK